MSQEPWTDSDDDAQVTPPEEVFAPPENPWQSDEADLADQRRVAPLPSPDEQPGGASAPPVDEE